MEKQTLAGVCLALQAREMMVGLALLMGCERKKVAQRMLLRDIQLFQSHIHPFWGNSHIQNGPPLSLSHREATVNKEYFTNSGCAVHSHKIVQLQTCA